MSRSRAVLVVATLAVATVVVATAAVIAAGTAVAATAVAAARIPEFACAPAERTRVFVLTVRIAQIAAAHAHLIALHARLRVGGFHAVIAVATARIARKSVLIARVLAGAGLA